MIIDPKFVPKLFFILFLLALNSSVLPLALYGQSTAGGSLPAGVERVTSVEGITEYRLKNGMKVLLFPDQTKQTITVNVTYLVGSVHENYGETGMAHLLEHMVFKGTPKHGNIPQELSSHGARPNGSTWTDRTNYYETFAATDENLNWALDLESDRMVNSFIAKKDLDSEMTVVRNEFESGENDAGGVLTERMMATSYIWHNYGKTTIGAKSDLENVPIERLQAFYKNYYQPDNAVLVVAGKIDEAKTLALVDKYFSAVPRPTRKLQKIYTEEPTQDGERSVTLRRVGDTQVVQTMYHVPASSDPDYAAVSIITRVLGATPSGRLHKALVETKKASSTSGGSFQFNAPTIAIFGASLRKTDPIDVVKDELIRSVETIGTNPPTKEEVERVRAQMLKDIELSLSDTATVGVKLSEFIGAGDWRLMFLHRDRVQKVTVEEVAQVAAKYFKPSNRTLGIFVPTEKPDRAEIPKIPDLALALKDYKGNATVAAGEVFDPSPANIDSRTIRSEAGGVKLALLPKQTRGNKVTARLQLRFGDEKSLVGRTMPGAFVANMLQRGTANRTRQQIADELDKLKTKIQIRGGATGIGIGLETTRENLPGVMRFLAELLKESSFPDSEFAQMKQGFLTQLEGGKTDPEALATNELRRHLSRYPKSDFRYVSTPDEDIVEVNDVTIDQVRQFHKDFYGASSGQLTVIGDFDDKELAKLTGELFGTWKSAKPYTRTTNTFQDVAAANRSIETPDKANANFLAGLNLNIKDDNADYPALLLGNYIFGGGFLNSRLATRIRQKDGLSYGVGSQINIGSLDPTSTFSASAIYAPQNVEKLETAFKEELARMLKDGFTEAEVEEAKKGYLQSREVSRTQDGELANRLNSYLFTGRTMAWDAELDAKIQALTPEIIVAAMRKWIDPAKVTIVKAGDFAKHPAVK
jgi:zinc protease